MEAHPSQGWRNLSRHEESFNEVFYTQLRKTPWWFISLAFHGVIVLGLFSMSMDTGASSAGAAIATQFEEVLPDMLVPEVIPELRPVPLPEEQQVFDEPSEKDAPMSEENQTDNDDPHEQALGDPDQLSDAPFEGLSTNAAIGIGGNAGGSLGGPFGGRRIMKARISGDQKVVEQGLEWLRNHQDDNGSWDADGFSKMCKLNVCDGAGAALHDAGVSGLSLLAFLGAGHSTKHGVYKDHVLRGIKYLRQAQDPEGCFGPRTSRNFTYDHAIATMAVVEAYGLSGSPMLKQCAQSAIDFIHKCQNPYLAWRYGVRPGDNDTSVSGWMVMALKSAKMCDLRVDPAAFDGMRGWLDKVTEPEYGRVGYTARGTGPARPQDLMDKFPSEKSEALTAVGVLSRILMGATARDREFIDKGADLCLKNLPVWDAASGSIDMYYWYYGTLAMFQVGGKSFDAWNSAMKTAIIDHQRQTGDEKGSWDPVGPWGREGGRVYSTALMTMCMEVYYRYPRVPYTK